MAVPIALREDFGTLELRKLAKQTKDAAQARRLLGLAEIYNGGSRTDAAWIGGVTLQLVRDGVLRFNKHGPSRRSDQPQGAGQPSQAEQGATSWYVSANLKVPHNITLLPLPPRSPELNPVENIWQFVRNNWLSNRIFGSYEQIVDPCCAAWTKLVDQPWIIMSIGLRDWSMGSDQRTAV